jgi:hypothetical protein
MAIDAAAYSAPVAQELQQTVSAGLHGATLLLPTDPKARPNKQALDKHRREAGL